MRRVRMQLGLTESVVSKLSGPPVTVAVLDSGIALHPDLERAVLAFRDFSGRRGPGGRLTFYRTPYDDYGHGTHVCGILCGDGRLLGGRYQGIFPGIRLVVGKVLDEKGDGSVREMLDGMAWVLSVRKTYDIRLLNISVGIADLKDSEKERELGVCLERLADAGILTVCAAGNKGPGSGSLSALGRSGRVLCVGCHDGAYYRGDPGRCETYSGCGKLHEAPRKPDVVAPGTQIISCNGAWRRGMPVQAAYQARSGTSMAAPIVTGALARTLQAAPELTGAQLRRILIGSARDLGIAWNRQGWGMVQPTEMIRRAAAGDVFCE